MKPHPLKLIKKWLKTFTIFAFLLSITACSVNRTEEANPESDYLIISSAFMMRSDIQKPNAALLIEDRLEIAKNETLFFDNGRLGHACGYHYQVQFWKNSDEIIASIPFNEDCEEFSENNSEIWSAMNDYIHQLETAPTHYIYNLKIPVAHTTEEIKNVFNSSDLHIFFMDGELGRFTTLAFNYDQISPIVELEDRSKWKDEQDENQLKAIDKINTIVSQIEDTVTIVSQSKISFPMQSFGGGEIQHLGSISLKFENGTDLTAVKDIIKKNGGIIDEESIPKYYYVQLVHTSDEEDEIKKILREYDFVTDVYPYPKTK